MGGRPASRCCWIIILSRHTAGDKVYHSEIFPALRALSISVERVGEVLEEMGVLVDDRRASFEGWLERKLDGLTPNIRAAVAHGPQPDLDGGADVRGEAVEIWLR